MASIFTPDRRVRVFVSSTLQELAPERTAVRSAVTALHLTPIMFELGARPHPPRDLYRAYLAQSDVFIGIYWERYGWVAPEEQVSGLEDEYLLSGALPKLVYVKAPADDREPRLIELLDRIRDDDQVSYKSFATPEDLAELVSDDLALLLTDRFAAATVTEARGYADGVHAPRLPAPTSRLVGRETELAELAELLADPDIRLVTVVGPGGIGKTRLAQEAARRVDTTSGRARFEGAWFVDLAPVHSLDVVERTIAAAFGVRAEGSHVLDTLVERLEGRQVLLVLDNLEHLPGVGSIVGRLLTDIEGLAVLGTSRIPLGLGGEREAPVSPLPPPESIELFVERGSGVRPGFGLTDDNRAAVFEIARRLEGIPLAIELAAAQLRLLTPQALLDRLSGRLDLHAPRVDQPDRQRTLRATIDWSCDLLQPEEQDLLLRLSVFEGGWTLEGAEAVTGTDVLSPLSALVASSLVVSDTSSAEPRFRMYDTVHEYAHQLLHERGLAEETEHALAEYIHELCLEIGRGLLTTGGRAGLVRLDAELSNIRAVFRRSVAADDAEILVRIAAPIYPFWWSRSLLGEMLDIAEQTAALPSAAALPPDARRLLLWARGTTRVAVGRADESPPFLEQLIAEAHEAGDERLLAHGQTGLALALPYETEGQRARAMVTEALEIYHRLEDLWGVAYALTPLGHMALRDGDIETAAALHEESLTTACKIDNDHLIAGALNQLGFDAVLRGDMAAARDYLDQAADLYVDVHDHEGIAACVGGYAGVGLATGSPETAARLLGVASHVRSSAGLAVWPLVAPLLDGFTAGVRAALGDAAFESAFAEGAAVPIADALTYARAAVAEPSEAAAASV